jgi:hypothetical protein
MDNLENLDTDKTIILTRILKRSRFWGAGLISFLNVAVGVDGCNPPISVIMVT